MASGIAQAGVGQTIFVYDDSDTTTPIARAAGPYTFAQISAAAQALATAGGYATDIVDNGTLTPSYRCKVNIQIGDATTNAATTTLSDTVGSTFIFDSGKTLSYRTTQTTSWFTVLGTKVGTGDIASGHNGSTLVFGTNTTIRGDFKAYGSTLKKAGTGTNLTISSSDGEMVNCIVQNSGGTGNAIIVTLDNAYNVDFSTSTTGASVASMTANTAERITVAGNPTRYVLLSAGASQTFKDLFFFGTPTGSDVAFNVGTVLSHHLVRPLWTGNAPKFGFAGAATTPTLANSTKEYRIYDVKVVDGTGAGISGIPVKLTDNPGNVQVNTTTGSDGELTFGSGLTTKAVIVMDHYSDGSAYAQRNRSPFYVQINTSDLTGYNSNYSSRQYYFDWPGSETVTTTSGTFEDINDVVNLQEPSGGQTSWAECEMP